MCFVLSSVVVVDYMICTVLHQSNKTHANLQLIKKIPVDININHHDIDYNSTYIIRTYNRFIAYDQSH